MRTVITVVITIAIVLLVIVGVFAVTNTAVDSADDEIDGETGTGNFLIDCISASDSCQVFEDDKGDNG